MAQTEFKIGDVVVLKSAYSGVRQEFVISEVYDSTVEVVWFNYETKEFNTATLVKAVFIKNM